MKAKLIWYSEDAIAERVAERMRDDTVIIAGVVTGVLRVG